MTNSVGRASPRAVVEKLCRKRGSSVVSPHQIAVRANPKLKTQNLKLQKLVPLLLDWFAANARDLPWRRTRDPYAIWVSEIMLQQTQVKTVVPFWNRWMRELPTIESAAKASPAKIHKLWEGLGYYTRVRNLQKAAEQIVQSGKRKAESGNFVCQFPAKFDDVLALPGIGRYTAGAICSIAFNQPMPILDGNVIRVLTRIFGIAENPKEKATNARLWKLAEELVTRAALITYQANNSRTRTKNEDDCCSHLNQSLMELGALVCTPRNPQCNICPVRKLCVAFREDRVEELPNLGEREKATPRRFAAFIVESNGHFLVRQRPAGVVNSHLWEFPNVEIAPSRSSSGRQSAHSSGEKGQSRLTSAATIQGVDSAIVSAAKHLGLEIRNAKHLSIVKHSITRYRITLEAFSAKIGGTSSTSPHLKNAKSGTRVTRPSGISVWKSPMQMQRLAFTAAHKKLASLAANRILSGR
jgi:A/G-specific adenine glycosylase